MDLDNLTETFKLAKYKLESSYNSVGALAGVDIRSYTIFHPSYLCYNQQFAEAVS